MMDRSGVESTSIAATTLPKIAWGKGSYVTYDGTEWSDYYTWEDQEAVYKWDPAAVVYNLLISARAPSS